MRRLAARDRTVDLIGMDVIWTAEFAEAGWLRPWVGARAAQVSAGVLAGPLATARYRGVLWAAPFTSNTQLPAGASPAPAPSRRPGPLDHCGCEPPRGQQEVARAAPARGLHGLGHRPARPAGTERSPTPMADCARAGARPTDRAGALG